MGKEKHDDAVDAVDYSKYALSCPTYELADSLLSKMRIVFECESIKLKSGDIEIVIPNDTISKYESITINGVKFIKEGE